MKRINATIFALCVIFSLAACDDSRRDQPGEAIRDNVSEGVNDVKRGAEDATEDNDNAITEGGSDLKRTGEDATD